jgi:hypothetical protein
MSDVYAALKVNPFEDDAVREPRAVMTSRLTRCRRPRGRDQRSLVFFSLRARKGFCAIV